MVNTWYSKTRRIEAVERKIIQGAKDLEKCLNAYGIRYQREMSNANKMMIVLCDGKLGLFIDEKKDEVEKSLLILKSERGDNKAPACGTILFRNISITLSDRKEVSLVLLNSVGMPMGVILLKP